MHGISANTVVVFTVLEFRVLRKKYFYFSRAHYVKLITRVNTDIVFVHPFACFLGQTADYIWLLCGIKSLEILSSEF